MQTRFSSSTLTMAGTALLVSGICFTMYADWVSPMILWHDENHGPHILLEKVVYKNQSPVGSETAVQDCRTSFPVFNINIAVCAN